MTAEREALREKKRIVIKIGSSSLTHPETGDLNLQKIEKLVRVISDLRGQGKEVVLVSSGAIAAGRQALGFTERPRKISEKQAFAAVGQARLSILLISSIGISSFRNSLILFSCSASSSPYIR